MTAARRLATPTAAFGWVVLGLALVAVAVAPSLPPLWSYLPLLIGIVLIGLPHGALDHLVPARTGFSWGRTPAGVTLYLLAYGGVSTGDAGEVLEPTCGLCRQHDAATRGQGVHEHLPSTSCAILATDDRIDRQFDVLPFGRAVVKGDTERVVATAQLHALRV